MKDIGKKARTLFSILIIVLVFYSLGYQMKANSKIFKKRMKRVEKGLQAPDGHPLLVANDDYTTFAKAVRAIEARPETTFWILSEYIDPAILISYYIYPKEGKMPASFQRYLYRNTYREQPQPVKIPDLQKSDPVVIVNFEELEIRQ